MTADRNVALSITDAAKDRLAKEGFDPAMGARPLDRVIGNLIKKPLSRLLLTGALVNGGSALVDVVDDQIKVLPTPA